MQLGYPALSFGNIWLTRELWHLGQSVFLAQWRSGSLGTITTTPAASRASVQSAGPESGTPLLCFAEKLGRFHAGAP